MSQSSCALGFVCWTGRYKLRLAQQKAGESIKDLPTLKRSKSYGRIRFANL